MKDGMIFKVKIIKALCSAKYCGKGIKLTLLPEKEQEKKIKNQ